MFIIIYEYLQLCLLYLNYVYTVYGHINLVKIRRWWVKPLIQENERENFGAYRNIFMYFRLNDHEEFKRFCGLNVRQFDTLYDLVKCKIRKRGFRTPLSPKLKLAAVLNFLANGKNVTQHSWFFRIGRSTMYKMIPPVCQAIYDSLKDKYLSFPDEDDWLNISQEFFEKFMFPNCLGAVDGKHFRIRAPSHAGSWFWNYRKFNSIVLLATCDCHCRFTWASVGDFGSLNDTGSFDHSNLGQALEANEVEIPAARRLPNSNIESPFYFIGDGGFPLKPYLLKPYRRRIGMAIEEKIFNIRLVFARKVIERAFGIVCKRWKIFDFPQDWKLETTEKIIMCILCLHNYIITDNLNKAENDDNDDNDDNESYSDTSDYDADDSESEFNDCSESEFNDCSDRINNVDDCEYFNGDDEFDDGEANDNVEQDANAIRNTLKQYFISPAGNVNWQWEKL